MLRAIPLLALLLSGCSAAPSASGGIVSTNPCADAMLVQLVPPDRIAAISHYSLDPGSSSIPADVARRFRATGGTAEEVIALHPDLVVADTLTPAVSRAAYRRAGLRVIEFGAPATVAESRAQVIALAQAVGAPRAGQQIVARIDAALGRSPTSGPTPGTLLFLGGDFATGPGTLLDELLARAGLRDAAGDYGLTHSGTVSSETLLAKPPALILAPDPSERGAMVRARLLGGRTRFATFPRRLINCGGPTIIAAMARLRAIRAGAP
ncbi:ABC transporter substrate-binding protein [Sphingomonas sp. GlSt437]|uniref:ABC transporter substrate-binding protein n=1 Tax=Sphingomonas sp. GlSt437 TaxID=3389970 RepID=UPI003A8603CE